MPNNILPFRKNLAKTLANLIELNFNMTAHELFNRHVQIMKLREEGYALMSLGLVRITEIEPITNAATSFDMIAKRSGIPGNVIEKFNSERLDWKAFEASRAALPVYRRL